MELAGAAYSVSTVYDHRRDSDTQRGTFGTGQAMSVLFQATDKEHLTSVFVSGCFSVTTSLSLGGCATCAV
jgi:hypothetical protein